MSWDTLKRKWKIFLTPPGKKKVTISFDDEEKAAREYDRLVRTICRLASSPYAAVTSPFFKITSQVRLHKLVNIKPLNFPTPAEKASGAGEAYSRCWLTPRAFANS